MNSKRVAALVAGALVAGLVLGNIGVVWAAGSQPAATTSTQAAPQGLGLRLGAQIKQANGSLAQIVAKLTGYSVEDVYAKRSAGQSFAQIAKSKGVSSDKVVDEALAVRQPLLDAAVKSGKITQAQADAAKARMQARLTERVDSTATTGQGACGGGQGGCGGGGRGMGRGAGMGGGMGGGCGGGGCGATQAPATPQAAPSVNL